MRRRPISPFSLSFLDIMFCGFGAVVLLVLILNTDTVKARNQTFADLRAEAVRLERERLSGEQDLVELRNSLQASERELVQTQGEAERVRRLLSELEVARAALERETLARREHANRLKTDLRQLEEDQQRLGAELAAERQQGQQVLEIVGQGDRQYLTGLKLGGKRVLILLDASASMLDETIVNVIRRRNLGPAQRRSAPKWRRALASTEWLIANLPPEFDWPTDPEMEIELKGGLGFSYRFARGWFIGGEALYETEFETEVGQERWSIFAGPSLHYGSKSWWATLTWFPQVTGGGEAFDGQPDNLHLIEKTKQEFRLKVGLNF